MQYISRSILLFQLTTFLVFLSSNAFSDARKESFRRGTKSRQFIAFGGTYKSDQNSKQYETIASYEYKSSRFINELNFRHRTNYAETKKIDMRRDEELYDLELSDKILILDSSNYVNFYNRSKYDEFSTYYYDVTTVGGIGRMFFGDVIEADINIGWNDIKNSNSEMVVNPTLKIDLDVTDRIKFIQKGYLFQRENTYDELVKSQLSYRLNEQVRLELYHTYEKNRYLHITTKVKETLTEANRSYVFRIKYDF